MSKRKALVVDDEQSVRFVVSRALKDAGWEVRVVDDGVAVRDHLQSERFDLLVLDLLMPGMNGFEVLRELRSSASDSWKSSNKLRVVVLSGGTGEDGLEFAARIGADATLAKPFELEDLWSAVG